MGTRLVLVVLANTTSGVDELAGEPAGFVGSEEDGDVGDVLGLAGAAELRFDANGLERRVSSC